jgi:Zinc knuckle
MDLSIGRLGGNLTDADKKKLMDEGRCFYCKEKGHRANRCPKKPQRRSPATQPTFPSRACVMEATNEENTKEDVHDLRMQLQAMTTEDRGELLDSLMRDDLDF